MSRQLLIIITCLLAVLAFQDIQVFPTHSGALAKSQDQLSFEPPSLTGEADLQATLASLALASAYSNYKLKPDYHTFNEIIRALKALLISPAGQRATPATIIHSNPALAELEVKVFNIASGRLWCFPEVGFEHEALVQHWQKHAQVVRVRRRKKTITTITYKLLSLRLPAAVTPKDVRFVTGKDGHSYLICYGEKQNSSLWLSAYRIVNSELQEYPDYFRSIPAFLTSNVSGKVLFRGSDLVFMIARAPSSTETQEKNKNLPETESSTYKFSVRFIGDRYVLEQQLPNPEPCFIICQFLQAVQLGHTDQAKSLLTESKLLSIPKYLALNEKLPSVVLPRVIEMATPSAGLFRYRLVTFTKNDLIFDIGKIKGQWLIKAIFIAPPDSFLQDISKNLCPLAKIVEYRGEVQ